MHLQVRRTAIAGIVLFGLAGCGGSTPPPETQPPVETTSNQPASDPRANAEAEARSLCEQADAAARQGDYSRARQLYQQAITEYPDTECARAADAGLARVSAIEIISRRIHFEFDRAELTTESISVLNEKADVLRQYPNVTLTIEGHCDDRGSLEYNQALGMRRAAAAKNYLVSLGLQAGRFLIVSFGEERPLVNAQNEAAWAQNRRDEFVIENMGAL